MKIKSLIFLTLIHNISLANISEKEFNELKQEVNLLKKQTAESNPNRLKKSSTHLADIEYYIKNGDCTALTTQPTNACSNVKDAYCYPVSDFNDADGNSLTGYTFTAVKSTLDYTNRDGGIWMCDSAVVSGPLINHCTLIGGNAHTRAANVVQFTIPSGTITTPIIVAGVKNGFGAIGKTSALTNFSICKQVGYLSINE